MNATCYEYLPSLGRIIIACGFITVRNVTHSRDFSLSIFSESCPTPSLDLSRTDSEHKRADDNKNWSTLPLTVLGRLASKDHTRSAQAQLGYDFFAC